MVYTLRYDEQTVLPYLRSLDLSREGRLVLDTILYDELRLDADTYLSNPERRLFSGSDCFKVDLLFEDLSRRKLHMLSLIISDDSAQFGILRIVYAEDITVEMNE